MRRCTIRLIASSPGSVDPAAFTLSSQVGMSTGTGEMSTPYSPASTQVSSTSTPLSPVNSTLRSWVAPARFVMLKPA